MDDLGLQIRFARQTLGLSQAQIAHALRVDQTRISKIELGKARLTAAERRALMHLLDLPLREANRDR
jgi:ribosome-binding protein aMBF1 (putative translation factor)